MKRSIPEPDTPTTDTAAILGGVRPQDLTSYDIKSMSFEQYEALRGELLGYASKETQKYLGLGDKYRLGMGSK